MLGAKRTGQRVAVSAGENPVDVRIVRRIQHAQRVPGPLQDGRGDIDVDVAEELRIPSKASHHGPREEHPEEQPPAPGVPALLVEAPPLFGGPRLQTASRTVRRLWTSGRTRLRNSAKYRSNLPRPPMPCSMAVRCRSQNSRGGRAERRPASIVQLRAARRWPRADQLQQFRVRQRRDRRRREARGRTIAPGSGRARSHARDPSSAAPARCRRPTRSRRRHRPAGCRGLPAGRRRPPRPARSGWR